MPTRRLLLILALAALAVPSGAAAHDKLLDHPLFGVARTAPPSPAFQSGGEGAQWRMLATIPTGNPQSDLDFFTQGGETFLSAGTLGTGGNAAGQTIVKLTQGGQVTPTTPRFVAGHPSATCASNPANTLGLQHDVEATPKGSTTLLNTTNSLADPRDTQLLLDASDSRGRCHDQGLVGLAMAPRGGLEIIDVTDPARPVEIGLTSHIGEAHTVNVDPKRPHIAYVVTSDSVAVATDPESGELRRQNEREPNPANPLDRAVPFNLDGFEVMDLSSCMNFPSGTTVQQKRDACRPETFRYRFPSLDIQLGHTSRLSVFGCHELEIYPDDRLTCGAGQAAIVFDMKGAFDDNDTPANFGDDTLRGDALPCRVRDTSSGPGFTTGAKITDCVVGENAVDLKIPNWQTIGSPSLAGVEHLGTAFHQGRGAGGAATPAFDSTQDIDFNHETEFTHSGRFLLATDERGGGVVPPGAACTPGADFTIGNGGVHAYRTDRLLQTTPTGETAAERAEKAFASYARTSEGKKAIYRAPIRTQAQGSLCTAHVLQQIPGQNRIFMGWYSQGTQVIDYTENADGTIDFKEAAFFIPANANQWVSHIFKAQENPDGSFTYFGAAADFALSGAGRNAIEVYSVTLPAPPRPAAGPITDGSSTSPQAATGPAETRQAAVAPDAPATGSPPTGSPPATRPPASNAPRCVDTPGFRRASATRRGAGLRFAFTTTRARAQTQVEVFQQSAGRRVTGERRVQNFGLRRGAFNWAGRGRGGRRLADGVYFVRMRTLLPNGKRDVRRIPLVRRNGRFAALRNFDSRERCGVLRSFKLERPAFGGRTNSALNTSFRVGEDARVSVTVRRVRDNRVVRTFRERSVRAGRTNRLRMTVTRNLARGDYRVTIRVRQGDRTVTRTLTSRRV